VLSRRTPRLRSVAATDDVVGTAQDIQLELGDGPTIAAVGEPGGVLVADLALDRRWPHVGARLLDATPIRSLLAARIPVGFEQTGSVTVWADRPAMFGEPARATITEVSRIAGLAMDARMAAERAGNLEIALESNRQIATAIGILMATRLLTEEAAFDELRTASSVLHRKVRDVAAEVVESGALPEAGRPAD
jgi:GAF domain-containing protein